MTQMLPHAMSARARKALQHLDGQTLHRLTSALADTETQTSMLSVHGDDGVGGVFIDEGRIAWAAAPGTRHFLSDRLVSAGADQHAIQKLVDEARRTGNPLGSLVVERGLMNAGAFAELLFEHTVVSLGAMASQHVTHVDHHPRRGGTFALAFTFPMVPLLAETVRRLVTAPPINQPPPGDQLTAVQLVVVDGQPVPVRVLGARAPKLSELRALSGDALEVLSAAGEGTISFRRGERCWSVSGNTSSFVVSEGHSAFSFAWMLGQSGH